MAVNDSFRLPAEQLSALATDARRRTLDLVADLRDDQLEVPYLPMINPLRWELGHVAFFWDAFVLGSLGAPERLIDNGNETFNSFDVDHAERWHLPLGSRTEVLDYMQRVFDAALERLGSGDATAIESYLYMLATQHEDMHGEAFTYTRQTLGYTQPTLSTPVETAPTGALELGDVEVAGGTLSLGASRDEPFVFDNEKWGHAVRYEPFCIARTPVSNGEYAEFVQAGGYRQRDHWSRAGWSYRSKAELDHPRDWQRDGDGWLFRRWDDLVPLPVWHPVVHVSWYEAQAYCRWAQRRLPSEVEWNVAAAGADGEANLDSRYIGTIDVRALAAGDSTVGCRQMRGNVWEWTASPFYPFPGYIVDRPYREYSAPWFGYHKVLKGGAWATRARLARLGYRNFFTPDRNDVLAGFRTCALQP